VAAAPTMEAWEAGRAWQADGTLRAPLALGRETRSNHTTCRYELRRARFLQRLTHTRDAILAGRLSVDHLDLFLQYANERRMELFLAHEAELVAYCERHPLFDDCRRAMQYWAQLADDVLGGRREKPAPSTLYLSTSEVTGEGVLDGRLSAIDNEIVRNELARLAGQIRLADAEVGMLRTPAQRRAAALVMMASRSLSSTGTAPRPLFEIIVGDITTRRLCELSSGIVVHPDDLVPYLDTALVEAFLFDTDSTIISVSRKRTFTGALRRAIKVRDRRCRHESECPVPARECDIDHIRPAAQGGRTMQTNGRCGCRGHNRIPAFRDHPVERPERQPTRLDELRALIRWRQLHDPWTEVHGEATGQGSRPHSSTRRNGKK